MVEPRTRDRVWKHTLQKCIIQNEAATPAKIAELADVSERTAREALNIISSEPYVNRNVARDGTVRFVKSQLIHFDA